MDQQQGASLIPLAQRSSDGWRDWAICEYRDPGLAEDPPLHTTMPRCKDWKLVLWHGAPATANPTEGALYHLTNDPDELQNLDGQPTHLDKLRAMKRR